MEMEFTWLFMALMPAIVSACFFLSFCSCSCVEFPLLDADWKAEGPVTFTRITLCTYFSHLHLYNWIRLHTLCQHPCLYLKNKKNVINKTRWGMSVWSDVGQSLLFFKNSILGSVSLYHSDIYIYIWLLW